MGILGFFMVSSVRTIQMDHLRTTLENEARMIADYALPELSGAGQPGSLDTLAKVMGQEIETRITIIAADGTVLGDSSEVPSFMGDHSGRPEFLNALSSGIGESTRYSRSTGRNMMYLAVPVYDQGKVLGVVRVALPLEAVQDSVNSALVTISWILAAAALLVILAAAIITRRLTRSIRQMTLAAENIASGHFDQSIEIVSGDEIGRLAAAFNKMAANLKETLTAVSEEKNKLQTVLSTITDGVIMTDLKGNILLANPAAEVLFNFPEERAIGRPLIEVVLNHEIEALLKLCLRTQQWQSAPIDTTGGKLLRVIGLPLKNDRVSGALLLFQDLTEIRTLQTMRREFIGNISHELRTPLTAIKAIVETLQEGAINDAGAAREFLNKVNVEVDSLTQMVNEIIELSRIETGRIILKPEPVDLNHTIENALVRLSPQAERKPVSLIRELAGGLPAVRADRERLQQVITNLVHNAIKFTPAGGKVVVKTSRSGKFARVEVADTGIGISRDDLPHIFERFFKADKSRTGEGSGLGLAISKYIVQAHGGEIRVDSREGKGSTFSFTIPIDNP